MKKSKLESQLLAKTSFLRGSINEVCANCKRAKCICSDKTKLKAYRLTYKDENQKTKIIYIPRERLKEARKMISNHKKVKEIMNRLMEVNVKIFRSPNQKT